MYYRANKVYVFILSCFFQIKNINRELIKFVILLNLKIRDKKNLLRWLKVLFLFEMNIFSFMAERLAKNNFKLIIFSELSRYKLDARTNQEIKTNVGLCCFVQTARILFE